MKIIRDEGKDNEEILEAWAHIQPKTGFFDLATPIFEGDIVEVSDPRRGPGGVERRLAAQVSVIDSGNDAMSHIHVTWGQAPSTRQAPVRRLTF